MLRAAAILYRNIKSRKWGRRFLRVGLFAWILGVVLLIDHGFMKAGIGRALMTLRFVGDCPCAVDIWPTTEEDAADIELQFLATGRLPGKGSESDSVEAIGQGVFKVEFRQGIHTHGVLLPRTRYGRSTHLLISGLLENGKPFLKCIQLPPRDRAMPDEIVVELP